MNKYKNKIKPHRFLKTTLAICISASLIPAQAAEEKQETKQEKVQTKKEQIEVIEVSGIRNALTAAMTDKRHASQVVDSIAATDIGNFSDANIAEALQRVPGIQIGRNDSGEGSSVALRGLRQTLSLVNGRTVFTGGSRDVSYTDIPSEAMARIDVYKSPTAKQIEGGISGSIDMRRLRSTDFSDFKAAVTVGGEYADLAADAQGLDPVTPKMSLVLGNNWQTGMGDVGALLAVNYQERQSSFDRSRGFAFKSNFKDSFDAPDGAMLSQGSNITFGQENTERTNIVLGFDWVPSESLSLFLDTGYTQYDTVQRRETQVITYGTNVIDATFSDSGLDVTTVQFKKPKGYNALSQYTVRDTESYNVALGGEYSMGDLQINAEVSYTDSVNHKEYTNFKPKGKIDKNSIVNVDYTDARNSMPKVTFLDASGDPFNVSDPANYILNQFNDEQQELNGSETAARVDFTYDFYDGVIENIEAGVRVTSREAIRDSYKLRVVNPAKNLDGYDGLFTAGSDDFYETEGGSIWPQGMVIADSEFLRTNKADILAAYGLPSIDSAPLENDTYDFTEKTYAAYGQLNMSSQLAGIPVSGNLGIRLVKTDMSSTGSVLQAAGGYEPLTVDTDENHILPSVNVKFDLSDDLVMRFAASSAMGRPNFIRMSPSTTDLNYDEFAGKAGNPYLKAYTADQTDVTLEWYFNDNSYVASSLFYKKVDGFLQSSTIKQTYGGTEFDIKTQTNGEKGTIKGLEVAYQQFFDFLPGYFKNLGVQANATWIDSEAPSAIEGRVLPLEGLSEFSYNVVGIYAADDFSARIAWNWRDDFFNEVNNDQAVFREASGSLSASFNYRFSKNLKIALKGKNLTRTELHSFYETVERPRDFGITDRRVELSVSYKL